MSTRHTFQTKLQIEGEDTPVTVAFDYWPGSRGHCDSMGEPEEPDDAAEIEIECVWKDDGDPIELTTDEAATVEKLCWKEIENETNAADC